MVTFLTALLLQWVPAHNRQELILKNILTPLLQVFFHFLLIVLVEYDALLLEALKALRESLKTITNLSNYDEQGVGTTATTLPSMELDENNCTIAFVSKDHEFTIIENEAIKPYVWISLTHSLYSLIASKRTLMLP